MYAVLYLRTHLSSYILFLMNEQPTYIVFDLEWNQCPYGKDRENSRLPFEIIDIGAVALNKKKEIRIAAIQVTHSKVSYHFNLLMDSVIIISFSLDKLYNAQNKSIRFYCIF